MEILRGMWTDSLKFPLGVVWILSAFLVPVSCLCTLPRLPLVIYRVVFRLLLCVLSVSVLLLVWRNCS